MNLYTFSTNIEAEDVVISNWQGHVICRVPIVEDPTFDDPETWQKQARHRALHIVGALQLADLVHDLSAGWEFG